MGRGRKIALWTGSALGASAAGLLISSQIHYIPVVDELWGRTPTQPQAASVPKPKEELPQPVVLTAADGKCVEPEQRKTWVIRPGDTALSIAYAIADETTPPANALAYELLKLNGVDKGLLQIGTPFITYNAGLLMPKILLPSEPIILQEGQPFTLNFGLDGLLCDGAKIKLIEGLPLFAGFDDSTRTLQWTPRFLQAGTYNVVVNAGDRDLDMRIPAHYDTASGKMRYDTSPRLGTVDIRVKVKPYEFSTDKEPRIRYRIVPGNDEFTPALTVDGKVGYVLNAYRIVPDFSVVSALESAANPEAAFATLHQEAGGHTMSSGSDLAKALDHLRRIFQTGNKPGEIEPFGFPGFENARGPKPMSEVRAYWFPVVTGEVQLAAVK